LFRPDLLSRGRSVKSPRPSDFPELGRVFAGYLHEDFPEEYGTPAAALRAFQDDANPAELRRFSREATRFLERTRGLDLKDVRELMARMGSRWTPPSRRALI